MQLRLHARNAELPRLSNVAGRIWVESTLGMRTAAVDAVIAATIGLMIDRTVDGRCRHLVMSGNLYLMSTVSTYVQLDLVVATTG